MSDFAFRMSSLDRKLAIGEMVSPADSDYDPEYCDYPDPLDNPEAFIQQYLQDYNSEKRAKAEKGEDCGELDHFNSCFMDFLHTCSNPELGENDLPGTHEIISLLSSPKTNGISSFRMGETKEAIAPLAIGAGMLASRLLPMAGRLLPFAQRGMQAAKGGLGTALKGMGLASLMPGGGGEGGGAMAAPIQTTDWDLKAPQQTYSNNRYEMPYQHITDNLMFEAATSPGPKKRNEDIETLRAQVIAALKAWADSGEAENRAEWWVYFSYAHEASTIAELQTILTAVPADYHNAVMTSPLAAGITPEEGNSGLPDVTDPAEGSASIANQDETPSPIPIDGAGTPQKMPSGQGLIPGALSTHDKLKIRPVFAQTDESMFEDYAEEDRPVLAKVAKYLEAGMHEEEIVDQLSPTFGLERTIWAVDQASKVANNDPLVDPAVAKLGINWQESEKDLDVDKILDESFEETSKMPLNENPEWAKKDYSNSAKDDFLTMIAENEIFYESHSESEEPPHDLTTLNEAYEEYIYENGEDSISEKDLQDKIDFIKNNNEYNGPKTFSDSGANEDEKINQQADSNLITPQQEKWAYDYTAMPNAGQPSTMGINAPNPQTNVGLPPNPVDLTQTEKQQQEMNQLSQLYPNVPPEMAKQWLNAQKNPQAHPQVNAPATAAGQRANPQSANLPSATTAKVAAWKDTKGNLLERGKIYKMTSPEYPIPDYVRVVHNGPRKLDVHLSEANIDITLDEEKMRTSKYKFEPVSEEKTSSLEKEAYYLPGYHAIISVHNPETDEWHTEMSPNDRLGHMDVLYDFAFKRNKQLAKANDRLQSGNMYTDHTARGIYNPQTGHLVHLSHPEYNDNSGKVEYSNLSPEQKDSLKSFWMSEAQNSDIPVSDYGVYGEEDDGSVGTEEITFEELPWEEQQKAMRAMRDVSDPTRGHWLEDEPWQAGKTKKEIEYWNRAAKWRPINKTANLSTSQQRELIDEQGVARNLDRLNLEGTHYPELANFEQTATMEEQTSYQETFDKEDQDLFL